VVGVVMEVGGGGVMTGGRTHTRTIALSVPGCGGCSGSGDDVISWAFKEVVSGTRELHGDGDSGNTAVIPR